MQKHKNIHEKYNLLKTNVLLDRNFPWRKPKRLKKESDTEMQIYT